MSTLIEFLHNMHWAGMLFSGILIGWLIGVVVTCRLVFGPYAKWGCSSCDGKDREIQRLRNVVVENVGTESDLPIEEEVFGEPV